MKFRPRRFFIRLLRLPWRKKPQFPSSLNTPHCRCVHHPRKMETLLFCERWPLADGRHTVFTLLRCETCSGITGFPEYNFKMALAEGSHETKSLLHAAAITTASPSHDKTSVGSSSGPSN